MAATGGPNTRRTLRMRVETPEEGFPLAVSTSDAALLHYIGIHDTIVLANNQVRVPVSVSAECIQAHLVEGHLVSSTSVVAFLASLSAYRLKDHNTLQLNPSTDTKNDTQVLLKLSTAGAEIAAWENELLTALVKPQLAASADGQTLTCMTGGLPITLIKVTKARKPTSQVSTSTGRRRTRGIATLRAIESGGEEQRRMSLELKSLGKQQLQDMLRDIDVGSITIPTGHLLSAQLDLGLNNSQRIQLRRTTVPMFLLVSAPLCRKWIRLSMQCAVELLFIPPN
ncbi:hypothetical protein Bbelb_374460 [Branchiostoma belcheri]|nr:hypothetical protein Bbelb_374460 [Branchiostoma belcheri]